MFPLPYFDAHCDTLSRCLASGESLLDASGQCSLRRLSAYASFGQIFAIFRDGADAPPEGLLGNARRQAALFQREKSCWPQWMERALLSVEGGELLECDPELLHEAAAWGVVSVNLTWNHANPLSGSHCDHPGQGLTDRDAPGNLASFQIPLISPTLAFSIWRNWETDHCSPATPIAAPSAPTPGT